VGRAGRERGGGGKGGFGGPVGMVQWGEGERDGGRTLVGFFASRGAGLLDFLGNLIAEISGGCVRGGVWGEVGGEGERGEEKGVEG